MTELFKMVWNFAKEVKEHAENGFRPVTPAQYSERMEICLSCEELSKEKHCKLCGCHMPTKAKWQTTQCADRPPKWKRAIGTSDAKDTEGTDK